MSWNKSYSSLAAFQKDEPSFASNHDEGRVDVAEQIVAAHECATQLIESGMVGAKGKDFSVNLSGHSNPNHEPLQGWANDTVTISVTQKP